MNNEKEPLHCFLKRMFNTKTYIESGLNKKVIHECNHFTNKKIVMPTSFALSYSDEEIMNSTELEIFLSNLHGYVYVPTWQLQ